MFRYHLINRKTYNKAAISYTLLLTMNFVEIQWIKSLLICSNKPLFLLCYTVQSRFYASINLAVHIKLPDVILCLHPHVTVVWKNHKHGLNREDQITVCGNSTVKVRLTGKHQRTDEQTLMKTGPDSSSISTLGINPCDRIFLLFALSAVDPLLMWPGLQWLSPQRSTCTNRRASLITWNLYKAT